MEPICWQYTQAGLETRLQGCVSWSIQNPKFLIEFMGDTLYHSLWCLELTSWFLLIQQHLAQKTVKFGVLWPCALYENPIQFPIIHLDFPFRWTFAKLAYLYTVIIELDWIEEHQWIDPRRLWEAVSREGWIQKWSHFRLDSLFSPRPCTVTMGKKQDASSYFWLAKMVLPFYSGPALWLSLSISFSVT